MELNDNRLGIPIMEQWHLILAVKTFSTLKIKKNLFGNSSLTAVKNEFIFC
jgi:hypothetical protein